MGNAKEFNHNVQTFFEYCRKGNVEKVNNWIQNKTKKSKSPLNFLRPITPCVGWLSCLREPSTSYTVLHQASLHGHHEIVRILIGQDNELALAKDRRGCLPLHLAAWNGHVDVVQFLLCVEPTTINAVNNAKECSLHLSAMHGHAEVVSLLLQHQANARLRNARFETALDISARTGSANICRILLLNCPELALQCAADSTATSSTTRILSSKVVYPLHLAARYGNTECISVLCDCGLDVNYVTDEGTALHVAASFGQVESVRVLLQHGADMGIRDCENKTVLDRLREFENQKSSDLTHVIQSMDGWAECRGLIEDASRSSLLTKSCITPSTAAENGTRGVIWRTIPENSPRTPEQHSLCSFRSSHSNSSKSTNFSSANSKQIRSGNDLKRNGTHGSIRPAFPKTSVNGHQISSPNRFEFIPNFIKSSPMHCNNSKSCNYQASPIHGSQSCVHENTATMLYDNAPLPHNRKWNHNCCENSAHNCCINNNQLVHSNHCSHRQQPATISSGVGQRLMNTTKFFPVKNGRIVDGRCTMPVKPTSAVRPSVLEVFEENLFPKNHQNDNHSADEQHLPTELLSNENGNGSSSGFATLERMENYADANTSAPIALPEELESSMCTSNCSLLSDRFPIDDLQLRKRQEVESIKSDGKTNTSSSNSTLSSENAITNPCMAYCPEQNFSSPINTALCNFNDHLNGNENDIKSSTRTTANTHSINQQNNSDNDSNCSPSTQSKSEKLSSDSQNFRSLIVNGKVVDSDESKRNISHVNLSPRLAAAQNSVEINGVNDDLVKSEQYMQRNHSAEWKKIDEILSSIQRGSFFASDNAQLSTNGVPDPNLPTPSSPPLTLQLSKPILDYSVPIKNGGSNRSSLQCWLNFDVGLSVELSKSIASILEANNFKNLQLMKGSLNEMYMTEMNIDKAAQDKIMAFVTFKMNETIRSIHEFDYLSDWLDSLGLIDCLGSFAGANLTYTPDIVAARLKRSDLEKIGVTSLGHISRIMRSLELAANKPLPQFPSINGSICAKSDKPNLLDFFSVPPPPPLPDDSICDKDVANESLRSNFEYIYANSDSFAIDPTQRKQLLLDECISFSAHYLGSMEISNVEGAEDCRRAMTASKKRIKQVNKVPQVILEISVGGVDVLDASTNMHYAGMSWCGTHSVLGLQLTVQHEINRIQVVCQDELDLNCFAYIFQDGEKNFCHVYCVLTAGVAKEIIVTLGEAFNIAFSLLNTQ